MSKKIKHHIWHCKEAGEWYEKPLHGNRIGFERVLILLFDSSVHSYYRLIRYIDQYGEVGWCNINSRDFFGWRRLTGD